MHNTREKPIELISKWDVVNKLIQLENNYQFYKEQWDADVLYRRICELEIGIGKMPGVTFATDNNVGDKWISVKDRLPEDICPVLVALEGLNIAFHGWYQDEKWWKVGAGSRPFAQKVTHWMPLPEPPKDN